MPGRGDNNKHGSAGRGSSNQSNQPFTADNENQPKSNHSKQQTGTKASEPSPRSADPDAGRNQPLKDEKKKNAGLGRRKEDPESGNIGKNNAGGFEHQEDV